MSFAKSNRVRVVSAAALVMAAILSLSLFATASGPPPGRATPATISWGTAARTGSACAWTACITAPRQARITTPY